MSKSGRMIAGALAVAFALLQAPAARSQSVASLLPAEPHRIIQIDDLYGCSESKLYFAGVLFEVWSGNQKMVRLAEQAAATYATPQALIKFDDEHRFLRGLDVRDYDGLKRFLTSLDDQFNMDVMVVAIPEDKRFASANEQFDAWKEIYIKDVVELGAKRCSARKN